MDGTIKQILINNSEIAKKAYKAFLNNRQYCIYCERDDNRGEMKCLHGGNISLCHILTCPLVEEEEVLKER